VGRAPKKTEALVLSPTEALARVNDELVEELDNAATMYCDQLDEAEKKSPFKASMVLARGMIELRRLMDESGWLAAQIVGSRGTKLGFRTDRDTPELRKRRVKNDRGSWVTEDVADYTQDEMGAVLAEGMLRGVTPFNDQINMIGGGLYIPKNGIVWLLDHIQGLVYSWPHLTTEAGSLDVQREGDGSHMIAKMVITWNYNGEKGEEVIPTHFRERYDVRVKANLGKAEKQTLEWLLQTIRAKQGKAPLPLGDVQSAIEVHGKEVPIEEDGLPPMPEEAETEAPVTLVSVCEEHHIDLDEAMAFLLAYKCTIDGSDNPDDVNAESLADIIDRPGDFAKGVARHTAEQAG